MENRLGCHAVTPSLNVQASMEAWVGSSLMWGNGVIERRYKRKVLSCFTAPSRNRHLIHVHAKEVTIHLMVFKLTPHGLATCSLRIRVGVTPATDLHLFLGSSA